MKATEHLYGCKPEDLPSMEEGLKARIEKGKILLEELLNYPLEIRDVSRITDVAKAIEHNTNLLKREV